MRGTTHRDGLPVGQAVATGAGDLRARWVIHTVGPNRYRGQDDPALLASCFTASLDVARQVGARSVAFPAVSSGAFGWEVSDVARIAVAAVRRWGASGEEIQLVRFVLFGTPAFSAFERELAHPSG